MILELAAGSFFALSGANKLFNKGRHQSLVNTLTKDNIPMVPVMQWWVPGWEFTAGTMLAIGVFPRFAAFVLFVICAVAMLSEARQRVAEYQPINLADKIDDYLYLPECVYAIVLLAIMVG